MAINDASLKKASKLNFVILISGTDKKETRRSRITQSTFELTRKSDRLKEKMFINFVFTALFHLLL
jgi:hypothetical protein